MGREDSTVNDLQKQIVLDNSVTESYATCRSCSNCNGRQCGITTMKFDYPRLVEVFGHALAIQITNRTKQEEAVTLNRWTGEVDE